MTKLERVSKWALTLLDRPVHVNEFSGPWFPRHRFPQRDQVVLGFVNELRQVFLLRHKSGGVYQVLGENETWFDDPPDRTLNLINDVPDTWLPVPEDVLQGVGQYQETEGANPNGS